jgi:hypothetical protein
MTGVRPAAFKSLSAGLSAATYPSRSASIPFQRATEGSSKFPFARFGMGLAYSFSGTTRAPAGVSVNEEKSA